MNAGEVVILSTAVSAAVSYVVATFVLHKTKEPHQDDIAHPSNQATERTFEIVAESRLSDYAVTGDPRPVPWRIRKREKESAARTKRRAREEFREEA